MGKVVEFPGNHFKPEPKKKYVCEPDHIVINVNDRSEALNKELDFLWNELFTGREIVGAFSDDDGYIHFEIDNPDYRHEESQRAHISFLISYLNDNSLVLIDFMKKYEKFIEETGHEQYIKFVEPSKK